MRQALNQARVVRFVFLAARFNQGQHGAHAIDKRQQSVGDRGSEPQFAVAQPGKQMLAGVRDCFEPAEAEEAASAFDGMNRAKDIGQTLAITGVLLQGDQVAVRVVVSGTQEGAILGIPASGRHVQWDGVDLYRLSNGEISNIWAGDDWTAILNDTGAYKSPWIA